MDIKYDSLKSSHMHI